MGGREQGWEDGDGVRDGEVGRGRGEPGVEWGWRGERRGGG